MKMQEFIEELQELNFLHIPEEEMFDSARLDIEVCGSFPKKEITKKNLYKALYTARAWANKHFDYIERTLMEVEE